MLLVGVCGFGLPSFRLFGIFVRCELFVACCVLYAVAVRCCRVFVIVCCLLMVVCRCLVLVVRCALRYWLRAVWCVGCHCLCVR